MQRSIGDDGHDVRLSLSNQISDLLRQYQLRQLHGLRRRQRHAQNRLGPLRCVGGSRPSYTATPQVAVYQITDSRARDGALLDSQLDGRGCRHLQAMACYAAIRRDDKQLTGAWPDMVDQQQAAITNDLLRAASQSSTWRPRCSRLR